MNIFYIAAIKLFLFSFLFIVGVNYSSAQIGVYDPTFGNGGKVLTILDSADTEARAVALQPDGKIIVGGYGDMQIEGRLFLFRYNANGTPDNTFGTGGLVTLYGVEFFDEIRSIIVQPDGKILVGAFKSIFDTATLITDADFYLFRLKSNGTFDSSFGNNGELVTDFSFDSGDNLHAMLLKPDGKILAAGFVNDGLTGDNYYGFSQYKPNGTLDSAFGTNGKVMHAVETNPEGLGALSLLPNDKILLAATFVEQLNGFYRYGAMRLNANGSLDNTFGTGGMVEVGQSVMHNMLYDMKVQPDGKIVMVGKVQDNDDNVGVIRLDSLGNTDITFGDSGWVRTNFSNDPSMSHAGVTLQIQPDGKLLVGGVKDNALGSYESDFAVVRYHSNGSIDDTFGKHGIIVTDFDNNGDYARASLLQPDGKFVLVGQGTDNNGWYGFGLVRYVANARQLYNTLKGSVYLDRNLNGVMDTGDTYFAGARVAAIKTGIDTINITTSTGNFEVDTDTGTYVVKPFGNAPYYNISPAAFIVSHSNYFNTDSTSFSMQPIPGIKDMFVYIIPQNIPRPGFATQYKIVYGNKGTETILSGTLEFIKDSNISIINTIPAANSISGDTLQWNFTNLVPFDTSSIVVYGNINTPPVVNLGDTLNSLVTIKPLISDAEPADNLFVLKENVVGSYDPNDKSESHGGVVSPSQVSAGEYLYYTIRFQNTGTDTAFNVYVRDTLSNNLNLSSMEMLTSSHSYQLIIDDNRMLWSFNNINLLDSNRNEPKSHGYIVYRVKPINSLTLGQFIDNRAAIYFDFNLPVITNTERTTVTNSPLPLKLISFDAIKNGRINLLRWRTGNEINFSHFEVQRSNDGNQYKSIGIVNSTDGDYAFTDFAPYKDLNYYRLRMIDKDGKFVYSPVRVLNNSSSFNISLYPNPVRTNLTLKVEIDRTSTMDIQVLNQEGKILQSKNVFGSAGTSYHSIDARHLQSGSYYLKVQLADKEQSVIKFEKL